MLGALALGIILQLCVNHALVGSAAGNAGPGDGKNVFNVRIFPHDRLNLILDASRVSCRGTGRRLHGDQEPILVLVGYEAFGHALENHVSETEASQKQHYCDQAEPQESTQRGLISTSDGEDYLVYFPEEPDLLAMGTPQQKCGESRAQRQGVECGN